MADLDWSRAATEGCAADKRQVGKRRTLAPAPFRIFSLAGRTRTRL